MLDRLSGTSLPERDLPEPLERLRSFFAGCRARERVAIEPRRLLRFVERERDLGLDRRGDAIGRFALPAREVRLADAEPLRQLADQLKRRNAVARLDPRDVGGRATRERELLLRQPGTQPRLPKPLGDSRRAVYVSGAWPRDNVILYCQLVRARTIQQAATRKDGP